MDRDSIFGIEPDQMNQLLSIGAEGVDLPDDQNKKSLKERDAVSEKKSDLPASTDSAITTFESNGGQIGSYKLLSVLGEGGMGIVYLAEQEQPIRRQVAMKVIKPGMDTKQVIARFEGERQALALLDHPNIAHVYEAGTTEEGRPYFVMEYVKGLAITKHCDHYKLSIEDRLNLFTQICQAIQHAHQKGIIHRDIKSSNILICRQDEQWVPKIIDFGVAKAIGKSLTEHTLSTEDSHLLGTPEYMSPEQADMACEDIDTRSDVYSLGVLLYVLLTGVLPFDAKTLRGGGLENIRHIIRDQEPKTPATRLYSLGEKGKVVALNRRTDLKTLARDLHKELEWIPLKAMRKERQHRYQTASELAQDIRNYLNGAALIAGPLSKSYKIKKFLKRNRTFVSAATIVALTIIIGSLVSLTMYIRAEVQAQRSQAVSSFLNDSVLSALDPTRPQGGEITVVSVLNTTSDALEGRFNDSPLTEAEIRHRLGMTYYRQGEYDIGAKHLQRALDLRLQQLGEDNQMTLDSMFELGNVNRRQGRNYEAEPLLLKAVAQRTIQLGEAHEQTLYAKMILARNYIGLGAYYKTMQLCQEVLNTARRVADDEHEEAILATNQIGYMYAIQGNYVEAERWVHKSLQLSRRVMGQDHSWTATFMDCLGWVYMLQGRFAESEQMLTQAISQESRIFGEHHPYTLLSLETLICLYVAWDKPVEAAKWRVNLITAKSVDTSSLSGSVHYKETTDTYSIRGSGIDIGDIFDEFHFAHKILQGDGSITVRIDGQENTDPWAKCGIMIRKTLDPTSEHASVFITPTGKVAFQYRSAPRGAGSSKHGAAKPVELPHWIRLTRRGNTFIAEHSSDGMTWEEVLSPDPNDYGPVEIVMDEIVHIGLAVTSHDAGRTAEARISNMTSTGNVTPQGPFIVSEDISLQTLLLSSIENNLRTTSDANELGVVQYPSADGLTSVDDEPTASQLENLVLRYGDSAGRLKYDESVETYTITGSGKDIWSTSDQFHFAYKSLTDDGSIIVRIDTVQPVALWTKAGVMMRNALTGDSEHASVFITPENRVCFQYRLQAGHNALSIHTDPNTVTLPHWVRLIRQGKIFKAQHSDDGIQWKSLYGSESPASVTTAWLASTEIPMNETIYIGLAVSSHAGIVPAESKMSHVTVTGDVSPDGEFLWSEDIGFQAVLLPKK